MYEYMSNKFKGQLGLQRENLNKSSYLGDEVKSNVSPPLTRRTLTQTLPQLQFVSCSSVSHIISYHPWAVRAHPPASHIN